MPISRKFDDKKFFDNQTFWTVLVAAQQLSNIFDRKFTEEQILSYGLNKENTFKLSVKIGKKTAAKLCKEYNPNSGIMPEVIQDHIKVMGLEMFINYKYLEEGEIYDLPMIGGEILYVNHKLDQLTRGSAKKLKNSKGTYVVGPDGQLYQLQEYDPNVYAKLVPYTTIINNDELPVILTDDELHKLFTDDELNYLRSEHSEIIESTSKVNFFRNPDIFRQAGTLPEGSDLLVRASALLELANWLDAPKETEQHAAEESGKEKQPSQNEEKADQECEMAEQPATSNIDEKGNNSMSAENDFKFSQRAENSDLNIIGGLINILKGNNSNKTSRLPILREPDIIKDLIKTGDGLDGMKLKTLKKRFKLAADNKHKFPREVRTDIYIIGWLVEFVKGMDASQKFPFDSDDAIITALTEVCKNIDGMEEKTLKRRCTEALLNYL